MIQKKKELGASRASTTGAGRQDAGDIANIVSPQSIHWESEAQSIHWELGIGGSSRRREFKELRLPADRCGQGSALGPNVAVRRRSLFLLKDEDQVNLLQTLMD
jgi:hypothetical protein